MLVKEYRICMPITVEEYRVGQLYMIAKHSAQNSGKGEGIEIIINEPCEDPVYGKGQHTEKRIHLGRSLPSWVKSILPKIFYISEKAWNYYPYTITEYTCSFVPRFSIKVVTRYEDNNGENDQALAEDKPQNEEVEVDQIDIVNDPVPEKHQHECEDLKKFVSEKTGRGPWQPEWRESSAPVMCSYKIIESYFGIWGLQTKVERHIHKVVRDVLLAGHVQAVQWIDEWYGMTMDDLREYESKMNAETNAKMSKRHGSSDDLSDKTE